MRSGCFQRGHTHTPPPLCPVPAAERAVPSSSRYPASCRSARRKPPGDADRSFGSGAATGLADRPCSRGGVRGLGRGASAPGVADGPQGLPCSC